MRKLAQVSCSGLVTGRFHLHPHQPSITFYRHIVGQHIAPRLGVFCDVESGRKHTFIDFLNEEPAPATQDNTMQANTAEGASDAADGSQVVQPAIGTETPAQGTGGGVPENGQQTDSQTTLMTATS
jgi:hypothetical protein